MNKSFLPEQVSRLSVKITVNILITQGLISSPFAGNLTTIDLCLAYLYQYFALQGLHL